MTTQTAVPAEPGPTTTDVPAEPLTMLRRADVLARTGLGSTSLHNAIRRGEFPKGRRVPGCPGIVVWRSDEVEEWMRSLPENVSAARPWHGRAARAGLGDAVSDANAGDRS